MDLRHSQLSCGARGSFSLFRQACVPPDEKFQHEGFNSEAGLVATGVPSDD